MRRLLLRRLAAAPLTVLGIVLVVFLLVEAAPGSPADAILGDRPVDAATRARLEAAWGLDRPAPARLLAWVGSVARGDLGWSPSRSRPVTRVLADAFPATLLLSGLALTVHLAAGFAMGTLAARRPGRLADRVIQTTALVLWSAPAFWLGLVAILLLAYALPIFPASSSHSVSASDWPAWRRAADLAWHATLPALVLGLSSAAVLTQHVRAGLVRALGDAFVRAARARGAGSTRAMLSHALRHALLPAVHLAGLSLPSLVSGALAIEVVFGWPGMGRVAYDAVLARDVPVVLATTLAASVLVVLGNLAADLGAMALDPRVRRAGLGDGG
ncbi:MAG TPA: ABC transporter permease [Candidatus Polarisedimenticolaceae bacterium]